MTPPPKGPCSARPSWETLLVPTTLRRVRRTSGYSRCGRQKRTKDKEGPQTVASVLVLQAKGSAVFPRCLALALLLASLGTKSFCVCSLLGTERFSQNNHTKCKDSFSVVPAASKTTFSPHWEPNKCLLLKIQIHRL